ncbi:MAG: carboxypeptidase regulatory-like domain-containing protein [Acidobacteria bacterium]|nr:carboxypeptidase regulatory-like domain-containing protein [Acidobacteriota bacterium]
MGLLLASVAVTLVVQSSPSAAPPGAISGIVLEEGSNVAVGDARVVLVLGDEPPASSSRPPETVTDAAGRYAFRNIAPGRYRLSAHKEGFALPVDEAALPIVDLAGGEVTDVEVLVQRGGVISGTVLSPSGEPIVNASVGALLKRLDLTASPSGLRHPDVTDTPSGPPILMPLGADTTDAHGEFRIDGLPAGDYIVAARATVDASAAGDAGGAAGTTYYPGTPDEAAADVVSVQTGRTSANIDVRLAIVRTYEVSGLVVDEAGEPVQHATVSLMPDLRDDASLKSLLIGAHSFIQADANGAFAFRGIPAGAYTVASAGGGDVGSAQTSRSIAIDNGGIPFAGQRRSDVATGPGTLAITIADADVSNIRLIVKKP